MGPAGGLTEERRNAGAGRPSRWEGGTVWQMASTLQIPSFQPLASSTLFPPSLHLPHKKAAEPLSTLLGD